MRIDEDGVLARAKDIAEQRTRQMFSDKDSPECKAEYQRIVNREYYAMVTPPRRVCKYCGK